MKAARFIILFITILIASYLLLGEINLSTPLKPCLSVIIYPFTSAALVALLILLPLNMYLWLKKRK